MMGLHAGSSLAMFPALLRVQRLVLFLDPRTYPFHDPELRQQSQL
jgi:hypothetical protein